MEYNFREIEKKWQKRWVEEKTYQVTEDDSKQKFYVLNMFPYPSGAGLHVGHPWDTSLRTFTPATNDCKASTYSTRWDMTHTDCPPNNMPSKPDNIRQSPPTPTSNAIKNNWTTSDSPSTGTAKYVHATPNTTTGPNGLSKKCSIATIATTHSRHAPSKNWKKHSPSTATKD